MRTIYLAHPLAGDVASNLARARRWLQWAYRNHREVVVLAPWMHEVELLAEDDADPVVREAALRRCAVVARLCDEVWLVGGRVTPGMEREAAAARFVRDLTELGEEPPEGEA